MMTSIRTRKSADSSASVIWRLSGRFRLCSASLFLLACSEAANVTRPNPIEIAVNPASTTVSIGDTRQLTANVRDGDGEPVEQSVFWSSSDTTIAIVNENGIVTARKAGEVQIAATALGVSATAQVKVSSPTAAVVVKEVLVSPLAAVVKSKGPPAHRQVQLTANAYDDRGRTVSGRTVQWKSSSPDEASVSSSGRVTGHSPGTVVISATVDGKTGTATVVVVR